MNDFKAVIKSQFSYVWISQLLSQLTINIMNFLLIIRLFSVTESSIATSMLWVAYALPAILIGPIAAASVDFVDNRKLLMITNLLQALVVLVYAFSHAKIIFLAYGVAVGYSLLNQFYAPAEAASVPALVKKDQLAYANSLFFFTQQASLILGFGLAGPMNHFLGYKLSFLLCALLLFLAFVSVSFLPSLKPKNKDKINFEKDFFGFFEKIFDGYRFIKENNVILFPFLLLIAVQVILAIIIVNVPVIARDIIHVDLNVSGLFVIVPAGIGSVLGAIYIPNLIKKFRKKKIIQVAMGSFIFTALLLTFTVSYLPVVLRLVISSLLIIIIGLSFVGILVPSQTFLQEKTPGGMRGRVFGNFWFLVTIATVFPIIIGGAITELLGVTTLMLVIATIVFLLLIASEKFVVKLEKC